MYNRKTKLFAILLFMAAYIPISDPVNAEDYPYSGYFSFVRNDSVTEHLDRRCALSFIHQENDGKWIAYHLDLAKFKSTQEISYFVLSQGHCTFERLTSLEKCKVEFDRSFREQEGSVFQNLLEAVEQTRVKVKYFDSDADYNSAVKTNTLSKEGYTHYFHRCPQAPAVLKKYASVQISPLTEGEIHKLRTPDRMFLLNPIVLDVTGRLGQ